MMSDGLPEAENSKNEMVGYDRTLDLIKTLSDKSIEEIKDGLVECAIVGLVTLLNFRMT